MQLFYTNKQIELLWIMKLSYNIFIRRAQGNLKRRLGKCQEDEELLVVVQGEAEDARFEEYGVVPDEDE